LVSDLRAVRDAEDVHRCLVLMLRAAVDVVLRGKEVLSEYRDPFGDGPFEYTSFDGGFELRSQFERGGKRWVKLQVGIRRAPA
jgi:hypothetical protein